MQPENRTMAWFCGDAIAAIAIPSDGRHRTHGEIRFHGVLVLGRGPLGASLAAADLINAVQSQLGLKLECKKGQAEVLVVDHMEKAPTGN
jgi:hypothetical protein